MPRRTAAGWIRRKGLEKVQRRPGLVGLFPCLSDESNRRRFFSASRPPADWVRGLCQPPADPCRQLTLLVLREAGGKPRVIATGSYLPTEQHHTAEVAMAVDDAFRGKGLGTLLLERLALVAVRHGIHHFWAVTQSDNRAMADVFRESGLDMREELARGPGSGPIDPAQRAERDADRDARPNRDGGFVAAVLPAAAGGRRRRLAEPRQHRRPTDERPARKPFRRPGLSDQSEGHHGGAAAPIHRCATCPGRWTWRSLQCRPAVPAVVEDCAATGRARHCWSSPRALPRWAPRGTNDNGGWQSRFAATACA